jgi:hypothetical protein
LCVLASSTFAFAVAYIITHVAPHNQQPFGHDGYAFGAWLN